MRTYKGSLKRGDTVMVIAGGNSKTRPMKGQIGKILSFSKDGTRVVVEGINIVTKHRRPTSMQQQGGKVQVESGIAISNVMYYVEKLKKPVRLKTSTLEGGKKVRGYTDLKTKSFVQID